MRSSLRDHKLSLDDKVSSLIGGSDRIISKESQSFDELLRDRAELRSLA